MNLWDYVQGGLMLLLAALLVFFIFAFIGSLFPDEAGGTRAERIGVLIATIAICIVYLLCYIFAYIV